MPLIDIWKAGELRDKRVQQILGFAGEGTLRDGNAASAEFRAFLAHVPSDKLMTYAHSAWSGPFRKVAWRYKTSSISSESISASW